MRNEMKGERERKEKGIMRYDVGCLDGKGEG